jgi:hypothetical protein
MLGSPDSTGVRRTLECGAPAPVAGPQEAAGPVDMAGPPDAGAVRIAAAMMFIFSPGPWVKLYRQRAAAPGRPIHWDSHVIAIVREADTWRVVDPDSRLPAGICLSRYLEETFAVAGDKRGGPTEPLFRCIPWETAQTTFGSDRSHMRTSEGEWIETPPPWPPINPEQHTLPAFISPTDNGIGQLYSLHGLLKEFAEAGGLW